MRAMTQAQAKARHAELAAEIRRHDHAYYVLAQPAISDFEYDKLFSELQDLEKQFPELVTPESPTQRVGGAPSEGFQRVKHLQPMLSLEKLEGADHPSEKEVPDWFLRSCQQDENTLKEFRAFDTTIRKHLGRDRVEYIMEPKVDGVSLGVHYRFGKLALGVTRGDGQYGDDITTNLRTVRAIPLELKLKNPPALLEVRGEAFMATKDFEAVNSRLKAAGEKAFPNARNATAGALKQLDPRLVAQRPIRAVFYAVGACEGIEFETHAEMLKQLSAFGLPTQQHWWLCGDMEEVIRRYRESVVAGYDEGHDLRSKVPYEIDGIVIKVNRMADWARIPAKTRAPGYAIVHKPIPWITPAETVLESHHGAGWTHRRAHARGGTRTGLRARLDDFARHAAQRGRNPPQRHPHRRHGGDSQGGHGDSRGLRGGEVEASAPARRNSICSRTSAANVRPVAGRLRRRRSLAGRRRKSPGVARMSRVVRRRRPDASNISPSGRRSTSKRSEASSRRSSWSQAWSASRSTCSICPRRSSPP